MLPGKTEAKQDTFFKFILPVKGYFRETFKSKNIIHISPAPKFNLSIIQLKLKAYQLVVSG